MINFLSCDWGTTNFRLRLVEPNGLSIRAEVSSHQGIAMVHSGWKNAGNDRETFYSSILREAVIQLQERTSTNLTGLPLLISGMASSSLGIRELPYAGLPFDAMGEGAL
ncbi:MAG: 2-keto-3-deoxy-galactonokinase, partial [Pedobacter sp.]